MIKRIHEDFFELESGEKTPFFEFPAPKSTKIIVQHPYMFFDPLGGGLDYLPKLIYNKTIQVDYKGDITFIEVFENYSEQKACIKVDRILWYWTGYWTVLKNGKYFIGSGLVSLKNAIGDFDQGKASYCLTNRDSIILLNFEFNNGLIEKGIVFDYFINNAFLPYVEIINPFIIAIAKIGKIHNTSEKRIKILDIYKTRSGKGGDQSPLGGIERIIKANMQPRKFVLNPTVCVRDRDDFSVILVAIINEFSTKWKSINSLKYLIGNCGGGFIETDFIGDKEFNISGEILFLNNNILLTTNFNPHYEFKSLNETFEFPSENDVNKLLESKKITPSIR